MKVRAVKSFAGPLGSYSEGQVFELPPNVDWLTAGLVEPVDGPIEFATIETPEKAVRRVGRGKGRKAD
jgi:hypothetical protein